jgi:tripartite-type tricarboxylate transporter receptor subunit TctC
METTVMTAHTTLLRRRHLLGAAAACALPGTGRTQTPAVPPKPALPSYRFVVGFGAGGVPDAAARAIAATLSERWQIPAVVENKLGAGGTLAAQAVLAAPADGATILSVSPAHATAPAIYRRMPYDTLRDFTPVTLIGDGPALVVVPNDLKARNLAELVAAAKASPGQLSYSSAGVGSSSHFAAALLCMQAGIDVLNIPYKSIGEALTETIAGRVQFHVAPFVSAAKLVKEGKLRALAVTGPRRLAELPDVPTAAESGLAGYEWSFWYGLLVSAKTPAPVVEQLHRDLTGILRLPAVTQHLERMGVSVAAGTPAAFRQLLEAEVAKYARIAKAANIQPE